MSDFIIDRGKVFEDENGKIYFEKRDSSVDGNHSLIARVYPEELGYLKVATQKIYVVKKIQSENQLQDSELVFEMVLEYSFEDTLENKHKYFYVCRSGRVMLAEMDSLICSECGVNNSKYVVRKSSKKLPENSRIPRNAPIFVINPTTQELERKVEDTW